MDGTLYRTERCSVSVLFFPWSRPGRMKEEEKREMQRTLPWKPPGQRPTSPGLIHQHIPSYPFGLHRLEYWKRGRGRTTAKTVVANGRNPGRTTFSTGSCHEGIVRPVRQGMHVFLVQVQTGVSGTRTRTSVHTALCKIPYGWLDDGPPALTDAGRMKLASASLLGFTYGSRSRTNT
jgi:hypothetical protein